MEANELRIGNIVGFANTKHFKTKEVVPYKIVELKQDSCSIYGSGNYAMVTDYGQITPILLTGEILANCGLEDRYVKGEWSWHLGKWGSFTEIRQRQNGYKFIGDYPPIQHLHQLQNLYYALTGEELPVNIPVHS